jgi:hypothetical protein
VDVDGAETMYRNLGKEVFGYSFGGYTRGIIRGFQKKGFYNGKRLKEIIEEFVGETEELSSLHSLPVKIFVVSAKKQDGKLKPFIFRSYESREEEKDGNDHVRHQYYNGSTDGRGITLAQALLATSAAPAYLPSIFIGALYSSHERKDYA